MKTQLDIILKRLFEIELGLYPDEFPDENMYELSLKSEAIKQKIYANRIEKYKPKVGHDGIPDYKYLPITFIIDLEKIFDIDINDNEAEKIFTFSELADIIIKKRNEMFYIHLEYYEKLLKAKEINTLIVGKDPFPNGAMGIPFCKKTIKEQSDRRSSGYFVLNSLGIDLKKYDEHTKPSAIFFKLLEECKIGFINASYYFLAKKTPSDFQIFVSSYINSSIFKKSKQILVTESALKILNAKTEYQKNFKLNLDDEKLLPTKIDERFLRICHPAGNNYRKLEHKQVWQEYNGLSNNLKDTNWIREHRILK